MAKLDLVNNPHHTSKPNYIIWLEVHDEKFGHINVWFYHSQYIVHGFMQLV